jgi:DNA-binding transcriptional LysR family regulator
MAFAEMLRAAPRITIKAMVSDADEILAALHSGQLDIVVNILYPTTPPPAGLVFIPLYEEECVPLCAPSHRLAAHTHVPLVELSKERWALSGAVHSESVLSTLRKLREVFRNSGLEPPHIAFESRSLSLRLQVSANSDLLLYTSRAHARRLMAAPLHVLPARSSTGCDL